MRPIVSLSLAASALLLLALPATAQRFRSDDGDPTWLSNCRDHDNGGDDHRGRACEVRAVPVHLAARSIEIDGRQNGSIHVTGWDGDSVRVTARLQAYARTDDVAKRLLGSLSVTTDGRGVRTEGPSMDDEDRTSWAVSYVVYVPRHFDLSLDAHNGSLRVEEVQGKLELRTTNGSLSLGDVGGDVRARTQNGSLNIQLAGARWSGSGLDAQTQNGSVRLQIPEHYAAQLETGTVNGRIHTDIPLTVSGTIGRRFSIPLNGGGPTIRAITTNGSITIKS